MTAHRGHQSGLRGLRRARAAPRDGGRLRRAHEAAAAGYTGERGRGGSRGGGEGRPAGGGGTSAACGNAAALQQGGGIPRPRGGTVGRGPGGCLAPAAHAGLSARRAPQAKLDAVEAALKGELDALQQVCGVGGGCARRPGLPGAQGRLQGARRGGSGGPHGRRRAPAVRPAHRPRAPAVTRAGAQAVPGRRVARLARRGLSKPRPARLSPPRASSRLPCGPTGPRAAQADRGGARDA
jgi:hypothetical protein